MRVSEGVGRNKWGVGVPLFSTRLFRYHPLCYVSEKLVFTLVAREKKVGYKDYSYHYEISLLWGLTISHRQLSTSDHFWTVCGIQLYLFLMAIYHCSTFFEIMMKPKFENRNFSLPNLVLQQKVSRILFFCCSMSPW